MSVGTDTIHAGWCRFRAALSIRSIAGEWRVQPLVRRRTACFPGDLRGFPCTHRQRLADTASGGARANERPSVLDSTYLRHQSPRCAVGPSRQKLYDALSEKALRCVVGPHLGYTHHGYCKHVTAMSELRVRGEL